MKKILYILLFISFSLFAGENLTQTQANSLKLSEDLIRLTEELSKTAAANNELSQKSMLQLSQDIGDMADRINEMADKINVMADKIVETQKIQSQNLEMTQENLLQAQKNLLSVSGMVDSSQVKENLNTALQNIQEAEEKNKIQEDILSSKNIDELISKMNQSSPKYRYMYMNAIKMDVANQKSLTREEQIKSIIAKIKESKESAREEIESHIDTTKESPVGIGRDTMESIGESGMGMGGSPMGGGIGRGGRF